MSNETVTYSVQGMSCQHCVAALTEALTTVRGVQTIDVDLESARARLTVDSNEFQDYEAASAAAGAGYPITSL